MSLTPPINSAGIFKLSPPFDSQLIAQVSYTCKAIRQMGDFVKLGIDPFGQFYEPHGLTRTQFDADSLAGECIVSIQSTSGQWVYVPTSYIQSYPNMGGIPYTGVVLAVNVGPLPDYLDLTPVKNKIKDVVRERLGVTVTDVTSVVITPQKLLAQSDANAIEAARLVNVTDSTTDYSKYLAEKNRADALQAKVTELETWIRTQVP